MLNACSQEVIEMLDMEDYLDEPICPICGANHSQIGRQLNADDEIVYYCRECGNEFTNDW